MSTVAKRTDEPVMTGAVSSKGAQHAGASVKVTNLRPVWLNGTEDIVIDHELGWAYISSQVYQSQAKLKPQGAIYGLNLEQPDAQPINLTAPLLDLAAGTSTSTSTSTGETERRPLVRPNGAFHPHGLSLYAPASGEKRLFVVNHDDDEHTRVEVFAAAGPRLKHLRTISDDAHLTSPNDLLAVGPKEEFYLSNDHGFRVQPLKGLEDLLHLRRGTVVYFDGQHFTKVASGIAYANGLAMSNDGQTLYVAAMWDKKLLAYPRDPEHPAAPLTAPREILLPAGPDNLEWDADRALWIGAQCDATKMVPYFLGQMAFAPSMILRIADPGTKQPAVEVVRKDDPTTKQPAVEVVWEDDGRLLSAASVATVYRRKDGRRLLLIGAAFDDRMLIGELT